MVKTQVQIPDHLYQEAKRVAREYEMSFAEVVRRGLERVVLLYPRRKAPPEGEWELPVFDLEIKVPLERLRDYAADDEALRSIVRDDD